MSAERRRYFGVRSVLRVKKLFNKEIDMGFFGGGYDKPGRGVDKNAPKKKGLFLYIELISRKFTNFLHAGILYSLFSIPLIVLIYLLTVFVLAQPINAIAHTALDIMQKNGIAQEEISGQLGTITFGICTTVTVFFLSMWSAGPLSAGLSYVFRCFTREQPVWVWSDGKDKVLENMKQGFLVLLIDVLVFVLAPTAITFYYNMSLANESMSFFTTLIIYVLLLGLLIYTMMHPFIFQLMVTFKCGFSELFKNSLLIMLAHLPVCVLLTAISTALITIPFGLFGVSGSVVLVIVGFTFGYAIVRYPMEFYAARIIKKTYLDKAEKAKIEYEE